MVGNRNRDFAAASIGAGKGAIGAFHFQRLWLADKMQAHIAHQGTGQEAGFAQDLKAIADTENVSAPVGMCM